MMTIKQAFFAACKTAFRYGQSMVSRLRVAKMLPVPSNKSSVVWAPFDIFDKHKVTPLVLFILNQPIDSWEAFTCLWRKAVFKVCVDGGTNHCFQLSTQMNAQNDYVPDVVSGDMDSVLPDVLNFYKEKVPVQGAEVIRTPDQDETDFTKALMIAVNKLDPNTVTAFVALVKMTGRVDHIFGIINTLHLSRRLLLTTPLYVVSNDSITWLLQPGQHSMNLPREAIETWCGLIPIGEPCRHVTTTGLRWNLRDQSLQFGGLVSTSNTFDDAHVTVQTDGPLLFTMGITDKYMERAKSMNVC